MMQQKSGNRSAVALIAGVLVFVVCFVALGWNIFISAVLALGAFVGAGQIGKSTGGEELVTGADDVAPQPQVSTPDAPTAKEVTQPEVADEEATPVVSEPAKTPQAAEIQARKAGMVKLGTLLPGEAELAERRGGWRYEG